MNSGQQGKGGQGKLLIGAVVVLVSLVVGVLGLVGVSKRSGEAEELRRLAQENVLYQKRIEHYESLTRELEKELGSLKRLDKQLTRTYGLKTQKITGSTTDKGQPEQTTAGGKGGPDLERPKAVERLSPGPLQTLHGETDSLGAGLQGLEVAADSKDKSARQVPSILPVEGGWVSSGFGQRISPFTGAPQLHTGVDFVVPEGTKVRATADGKIKAIRRDGANGLYVDVAHDNGLVSRYAHLKTWKVEIRQTVSRGHVIALSGMSGNTTGPHLHYEIQKDGTSIDPVPYLPKGVD